MVKHLHATRSDCPIATTLDLLGDKWTLVIIRDMVAGKKHFSDFLDSRERITTSILASRLAAMEAGGLIEKRPYQQYPVRLEYKLSKKGAALLPVLQDICRWAARHSPAAGPAPKGLMRRKA